MNQIVQRLRTTLGDDIVKTGADVPEHQHSKDYSVRGPTPFAVAYPRSAKDVSEILKACNDARQTVIPQGGMSGLAGGAVPVGGELAISFNRMSAIEEIDIEAGTMTVQAGVTLQAVQEAADAAGMLFPLDLGGRGSCQVGGMASTNAGGNRVLRYGMARALILGVEAVLPNGEILTGLNKMLKNNAGYDLKQLFIGSEGTLGVITRLVLRLFPKPASVCTAICAVAGYDEVIAFLRKADATLAGTLSAFEVMWPDFYNLASTHQKRPPPLSGDYPLYLLIEAMGSDAVTDMARFEALIEEGIEGGLLLDAVLAQSVRDAEAFWSIRDAPGQFRQIFWPNTAFDVSLPIGSIQRFVEDCRNRLAERWPQGDAVFFGHVADSNIHIIMRLAEQPFPKEAVDDVVYGAVRDFQGSISAEHGIGTVKFNYLGYSRTPQEIALMQTLKRSLDPNNILNPGKVIGA